MLYLLFELGEDRYALDVRHIVEVLPQVGSKHLPGATPGMGELINYRGKVIPLLDLAELALGQPCPMMMSTRIIVTSWADESGESHLVGLRAVRVTETIRRAESDFKEAAIASCGTRFSGPILTEGNMMIQRVELKDLLPRNLPIQVFAEVADGNL